jgi:hypothetical protein
MDDTAYDISCMNNVFVIIRNDYYVNSGSN